MATASVPNPNFVNGSPADADQVDANFAALVDFANNSVVHRDGSKAFTAASDMGGFRVTNVAAASASSDAPRFDQVGFGDYVATGSGVVIGTSATTVGSVSVTLPGPALALLVTSGTVTTSGVTFSGGEPGENVLTVTWSLSGVTTLDTIRGSSLPFSVNETLSAASVFLVALPSGASTINLRGTRSGSPSGGTATANTGFKLAVFGAF